MCRHSILIDISEASSLGAEISSLIRRWLINPSQVPQREYLCYVNACTNNGYRLFGGLVSLVFDGISSSLYAFLFLDLCYLAKIETFWVLLVVAVYRRIY